MGQFGISGHVMEHATDAISCATKAMKCTTDTVEYAMEVKGCATDAVECISASSAFQKNCFLSCSYSVVCGPDFGLFKHRH